MANDNNMRVDIEIKTKVDDAALEKAAAGLKKVGEAAQESSGLAVQGNADVTAANDKAGASLRDVSLGFKSFKSGMGAAAAIAHGDFSGGMRAATLAVKGLSAVTKANPVGLLISGLALAASYALPMFLSKTKEAEGELDKLKGKAGEAGGEMEKLKTSSDHVAGGFSNAKERASEMETQFSNAREEAEKLRKRLDALGDAKLQQDLAGIENRQLKGEISEPEADALKAKARADNEARKIGREKETTQKEISDKQESAARDRQNADNARSEAEGQTEAASAAEKRAAEIKAELADYKEQAKQPKGSSYSATAADHADDRLHGLAFDGAKVASMEAEIARLEKAAKDARAGAQDALGEAKGFDSAAAKSEEALPDLNNKAAVLGMQEQTSKTEGENQQLIADKKAKEAAATALHKANQEEITALENLALAADQARDDADKDSAGYSGLVKKAAAAHAAVIRRKAAAAQQEGTATPASAERAGLEVAGVVAKGDKQAREIEDNAEKRKAVKEAKDAVTAAQNRVKSAEGNLDKHPRSKKAEKDVTTAKQELAGAQSKLRKAEGHDDAPEPGDKRTGRDRRGPRGERPKIDGSAPQAHPEEGLHSGTPMDGSDAFHDRFKPHLDFTSPKQGGGKSPPGTGGDSHLETAAAGAGKMAGQIEKLAGGVNNAAASMERVGGALGTLMSAIRSLEAKINMVQSYQGSAN